MPGPQAFPQEGAYFTVPGRTSADLTAWHRKARRRFSDLIFLQLAQCTQEGMNTSPYKIISPRHNTVQRQVSGAMFIYNCIVNETAALECFWGDFLQLYLK